MKKILTLIGIAFFTLTSCSSDGEMGPPGPQGPPGEPGEPGLIGTVFDVEVDFTSENDFSELITYSEFSDVEVFDSDVVLVYLRVGQDGEAEGEPVYVWRQLPQTYYEGSGTVIYNFDYTFFSVNIFLASNMELSTLDQVFTQDQTFRIAILPAGFAQSQNLDLSNYYEVEAALKISERDVPTLNISE